MRFYLIKCAEWISRLAPLYYVVFGSASFTVLLFLFYAEIFFMTLGYNICRHLVKNKPKMERGLALAPFLFLFGYLVFLLFVFAVKDPNLEVFVDAFFEDHSPIVLKFKLTLGALALSQFFIFYEAWESTASRPEFMKETWSMIVHRLLMGQIINIGGGWALILLDLTNEEFIFAFASFAILIQYLVDRWAQRKSA